MELPQKTEKCPIISLLSASKCGRFTLAFVEDRINPFCGF
jgi:hypothetical protein